MNWADKIDQQQNALLATFYMFVFMALLVIRTGLDVRGAPASYSFAPYDSAPLDADDLSPSQCDRLDQLYAKALALLYAAELVARRLACLDCEIYELMKLADVLAQRLRGNTAHCANSLEQICAATGRSAQARAPPDIS